MMMTTTRTMKTTTKTSTRRAPSRAADGLAPPDFRPGIFRSQILGHF
jgi:hypothetical protein